MRFDIPLHIENNTPEARVIEAIISQDDVSPEEAVLRALRHVATQQLAGSVTNQEPGALLFGLYADEPELMQRIAETSRRSRDSEIVKDCGV